MFQLAHLASHGVADQNAMASLTAPGTGAVQIRWSEQRLTQRLALLCAHLVVALVALVGIGGATRVMEAGLACPDWPLCYGSLLPGGRMNMQVFLEWFHRLDAFVVGVALLVLCAVSILQRRRLPGWVPWLGAMALVLVAIQGGLGAITVLALLPSVVVTAHLAMALLLVAVISAASQQLLSVDQPSRQARGLGWIWVVLASLSLVAVLAQCLLGGAMATQWAAERCLASGQDCQWLTAHRHLGSFAAVAVAVQAVAALRLPVRPLVRGLSLAAAGLVLGQLALGLSSWHLQLTAPLVTVAHQVVAALLVAVLTAGVSREVAHG